MIKANEYNSKNETFKCDDCRHTKSLLGSMQLTNRATKAIHFVCADCSKKYNIRKVQ